MTTLLTIFLFVSSGQTGAPPAADEWLADPYVDGTYGYSIQPPNGWQVLRQRVPERRGVTLLQMSQRVAPSMTQEIVLKQTSTTQKTPMEDMLKRISSALELEFSDVSILSQQTQQIAGRPGAVLAASFQRDGIKRLRIEALIESNPQTYYVLLYNGPFQLRAKSEPLFYRVLGSINLLSNKVDEAEMKVALEDGIKLLKSLDAEKLQKAIVPEEFLKLERDGRTIGFVAVYQAKGDWEGRHGVRIRERGWTFESDGRARRLQNSMFISNDLKDERWKTSITTLVPAAANRPDYLEVALEEGLRNGKVLLTNQTYSMDSPALANPALDVPDTYAPRAIIRMLPRLLGDPARKRKLAFVTFDHVRAGMVARVVDCQGEVHDSGVHSARGVFRLDDREGLAADPTQLFVDSTGQTLLVKAGPVTMTPVDGQELERLFGPRIDAAQRRMAELEDAYNKENARVGRKPPKPAAKPRTVR